MIEEQEENQLKSDLDLERIMAMPPGRDRQMALTSHNVRRQQREREEREREENQSTGSPLLDWINLKRRRGLL